jgi:hypothetical protein
MALFKEGFLNRSLAHFWPFEAEFRVDSAATRCWHAREMRMAGWNNKKQFMSWFEAMWR